MQKVKVKDSIISSDWGDLIAKSKKSITVSWNGVIGIYTISKNEIEIKENDDAN